MKILLITSNFPPEVSGGIGRPLSLFKYLPRNGIDVTVITKSGHKTKNILDNNIYRFDSLLDWKDHPWLSPKKAYKIMSLLQGRCFNEKNDLLWIDSLKRNWSKVKDIDSYDLIYCTFPSAEVFEIGLHLKKQLQIPLISEFRDGMCYESVYTNTNILQRSYLKKLERHVISESAAVITIGQELSNYFLRKYSLRSIHTIYNGYDLEYFDFPFTKPKSCSEKIMMGYFGRFSFSKKNRHANKLFSALSSLKSQNKLNKENFELHIIGDLTEIEKKSIKDYNIHDLVKVIPQMAQKEGLEMLNKSYNVLLFYGIEGEKTNISSKLLEYLKLGKPILGICKGNEAERIIQRTGTGEVCDFDEYEIKNLVLKIMKGQIYYNPVREEIEKFDREKQTAMIADIIHSTYKVQNGLS